VDDILTGQPEPPAYFARMKKVNREGPGFTRGKWNIQRQANVAGTQLIDVRSMDEFLRGSTQGAIFIPLGPSFSKWSGSLLDLDVPITILANDEAQAAAAAKALILIGIENISGWAEPGNGFKLPVQSAIPDEGEILDVRGLGEREEFALPGSIHVPLIYLASHAGQLPSPISVHCASGSRAVAGASFLTSKGIRATAILTSEEELRDAALERESRLSVDSIPT
jgi:hydroxyacylglutathione hydrolase